MCLRVMSFNERGLCCNLYRDACQRKSDTLSSLPCRGSKGGLRPPSFLLRTPMRSIGYARVSAVGGAVLPHPDRLQRSSLPLQGRVRSVAAQPWTKFDGGKRRKSH